MLQRVLQTYKPGDELEIRYYLDPRVQRPDSCEAPKYPDGFRPVAERIVAEMTGRLVTKFIDVQLETTRKRIIFTTTGRVEEWYTKTRKCDGLVEPNDFGGFRVSLSHESPIAPTRMDRVDRITAKFRFTVQTQEWRLDVSAVKHATLDTIQDVKLRLLACDDPFACWSWWDCWEFEKEFVGSDPYFELADLYQNYRTLAPHINFDMLDTVRRAAAFVQHPRCETFDKISPRNTIARLLPKAIEPTLEQWTDAIWQLPGMVLRDKIDGTRELLWLHDDKLTCVNARDLECWDEPLGDTYIFDAEFYEDTWYVLHVLVWQGQCVANLPDGERLALLKDIPAIAGLKVCPWTTLTEPAKQIPEWWNRETPYRRDGLLLSTDESYWQQQCFKWKPHNESTIDMLIVRCPEWLEGKAPFVSDCEQNTLYLLNVGVNAGVVVKQHGFPLKRYLDMFKLDKTAKYIPQPFAPVDDPSAFCWSSDQHDLHGYIGEFLRCNDGVWQLKRVRRDKPSLLRGGTEIGNDIKTALDVWSKQTRPFPLEYLYAPPVQCVSSFGSLQSPLERVIVDLLEEESAQTAISHYVPFVPFPASVRSRAIMMPVRDSHPDYHPTRFAVPLIQYTHIGRLTLPKEFIGGAQLVVTMDPELLGHVSCIGKSVASGGRLVVICRFGGATESDMHPLVGSVSLMKDLERSGFTLLNDHGAPESDAWDVVDSRFCDFRILSFRKENRGSSNMTIEDVHKENPHLVGNPDANFQFKFSRQKTKDIATLQQSGSRAQCATLYRNPALGELLVDVEFLTTVSERSQILYFGRHAEQLRTLFPDMQWLADGSPGNVEVLISHDEYAVSRDRVSQYEPHFALLDFDAADLARGRVLKGKCMLHPFSDFESTRVSVAIGRHRDEWNILSDIWTREMQMFHRVYRASAFKYTNRIPQLDNCYDCRAYQYILSKYARAQKITLDDAYRRIPMDIKLQ